MKERFEIEAKNVMPFMLGEYKLEDAVKDLHARGKGKDANEKFTKIFTECQKAADSKQLFPMVRTQYMRTAFQVLGDFFSLFQYSARVCFLNLFSEP